MNYRPIRRSSSGRANTEESAASAEEITDVE